MTCLISVIFEKNGILNGVNTELPNIIVGDFNIESFKLLPPI